MLALNALGKLFFFLTFWYRRIASLSEQTQSLGVLVRGFSGLSHLHRVWVERNKRNYGRCE